MVAWEASDLAEGLKTNLNRISVSNSKWQLVKRFIDYLETYWKINRDRIFAYVRIKPENHSCNTIGFWSKKLSLNKSQIRVSKTKNKPPISKYGNIEVVVYNTALGTMFNRFFRKFLKMNKSKEKTLEFIKGVEDGDGHVMRHGIIEIGITCENKNVPLIKSCYSKLYGEPYIRDHHTSDKVKIVFYTGIEKAKLFLFDNHFEEHKEGREKLIELLKLYMKRDLRYLKLISLNKRTTRDIAKSLGVTPCGANFIIRKLLKHGFIKSIKYKNYSKIRKRCYTIRSLKLTEKSSKLIKYLGINDLKGDINDQRDTVIWQKT